MKETVIIKKSNRKTVSVEINTKLEIIVRAPKKMPDRLIRGFVAEKEEWIIEHYRKMKSRKDAMPTIELSKEDIDNLILKAENVLPSKVKYYADIIGVNYKSISVRRQKTRWGSCSAKGNLNFNCVLMLCPEKVIDYVVVHELCHLIKMNHSKKFSNLVESHFSDCKECEKYLKNEGAKFIEALRNTTY